MLDVAQLRVSVDADTKDAEQGISHVDSLLGGLVRSFGNVATTAAGFVLGKAFTEAPGALLGLAQAAADDAASIASLQQAVDNTGQSFSQYGKQIDDAISKGQALAFSDDDIRGALQTLTQETGNAGTALGELHTAEDLARGTGKSLIDVSKLMGKVTDENVGVFKKLGISVEKGASAQELMNKIDARFGNQAGKFAATAAGQWAIARDRMSEAGESLGYVLLPQFTKVATFLAQTAIPRLQDFITVIGPKLATGIESTIGLATRLYGFLSGPFNYVWVLLRDAVLTFQQALDGDWVNASGIRPLHKVVGELGLLVRNDLVPAWGFLSDALGTAKKHFDDVMRVVRPIATILAGPVAAALKGAVEGFGDKGLAGILPGAVKGLENFGKAFGTLGSIIGDALGNINWPALGQALLQGIGGALSNVAGIAAGVDWPGIAADMLKSLGGALDKATGFAWDIATTVIKWFGGVQWGSVAGVMAGYIADKLATVGGITWDAAKSVLSWLQGVKWSGVAAKIATGVGAAWADLKSAGAWVYGWVRNGLDGIQWGAIATGIAGGVGAAWGMLSDAADHIYNWMSNSLKGVKWGDLASQVSGFLGTALDALSTQTGTSSMQLLGIGAAVASIIGALALLPGPITSASALFAGLSGVISGLYLEVATAPTVMAALVGVLGGPVTATILAVTAVVAGLGIAYATNFLGMRDITNQVAGGILPALGSIHDAIQPLLDTIGPMLSSALTSMQTAFAGVVAAFTSNQALMDQLAILWGHIQEAAAAVAPVLVEVGAVMGKLAGLYIVALAAELQALAKVLSVVLPVAAEVVVGALTSILAIVNTVFAVFVDYVKLVNDLFHGEWSKAWADAKQIVNDVVVGIMDIFGGLPAAILGIVADLATKAVAAFDSLAQDALAWLVVAGANVIAGLVSGISGAWGTVTTELGNAQSTVQGAITDAVSWLTSVGTDVVQGIVDGITNAWSTLTGKIGEIKGGVTGAITDAATWLILVGGDVIRSLIDGMKQVWDTIATKVGEIKTTVTGAITDATTWLSGIGGDVVQGLVDGITGAAHFVTEAVDAIIGAIPKWVRDKLGISSPSKVMMKIAYWIPAGLALGIESGTPDVAKAAADAANAVISAFSALLDLGTQLKTATFPGIEQISQLKFLTEHAVRSIADSAALFKGEALDAAKQFADTGKAIFDLFGSVFTAFSGKLVIPDNDSISALKFAVEKAVRSIADSAAMFTGTALTNAKAFADAATPIMALLSGAVQTFNDLATITKAAPIAGALESLVAFSRSVVAAVQHAATGFSTDGLAAATAFADAVSTAIGWISDGVDAFTALATFDYKHSVDAGITALTSFAAYVIAQLAKTRGSWTDEALKAATDYAAAVSDAVGWIVDAVKSFEALAAFKPGTITVQLHFVVTTATEAVKLMQAASGQFTADGLQAAVDFSTAAGSIVDSIGKGVDAFTKLQEARFTSDVIKNLTAFGKIVAQSVSMLTQYDTDLNAGVSAANSIAAKINRIIATLASAGGALGSGGIGGLNANVNVTNAPQAASNAGAAGTVTLSPASINQLAAAMQAGAQAGSRAGVAAGINGLAPAVGSI